MAAVAVIERSEFRLATCRNLEVAIWYDPPTTAHIRVMANTARSLRRAFPKGIALLNVVQGGGVPNFADDMREAVMDLNRGSDDDLGVAHVVLVGGLVGAATTLVSRPKMPTRTFGELDPAAAWLTPLLEARDPTWSAAEVLDAYAKTVAA